MHHVTKKEAKIKDGTPIGILCRRCVCIEMAKSGQQLMAFPCIQMRKFDSGGGGRADMCGLRRRRR